MKQNLRQSLHKDTFNTKLASIIIGTAFHVNLIRTHTWMGLVSSNSPVSFSI